MAFIDEYQWMPFSENDNDSHKTTGIFKLKYPKLFSVIFEIS